MKKQSYQRILAVLISLMILLTAGMCIVGAGLLQTREDSPDILPEATATADSGDLLMASDLAPDPAKWFLPYDGDLTDADGNPVRLSALCGKRRSCCSGQAGVRTARCTWRANLGRRYRPHKRRERKSSLSAERGFAATRARRRKQN